MDIGAFGKSKGKQGQQGQQRQGRQGRDKSKDKNKDSVECWSCGKRGHLSKYCWSKNDNKGKHKKVATDAHNLDWKKPEEGNNELEVEIGGFHMCSLGAADEMRESEWIKIGVDTGAGKTAWLQNVACGRRSLVKVISFPHSNWRACQV